MLVGEKEFTLSWQPENDCQDYCTALGEDTITIRVEADTDFGLQWEPISHSWQADGEAEESTTFTDALGRKNLARARMWFEANKDTIEAEDPDFAGWRHINYIEREADHAWARTQRI